MPSQGELILIYQNIDENFSKIHHTLANKVLPALKRYAVATEPVREAAKFWTSFYEQAAQIHIPTYDDDYSTVNEESQQPESAADATIQHQGEYTANTSESHHYEPSMTSTDGSFMPGHAAFSSTPATTRVNKVHDSSIADTQDGSTWAASLDSPLVRIHQNFHQPAVLDESILGPSLSYAPSFLLDEPTPNPRRTDPEPSPRSEKGKTKEPLLRNVLRHNLYSTDASQVGSSSGIISPIKYRGKPNTPVPKKYNPFLPLDKDPADWDGVVDLGDPSILTPKRSRGAMPLSRRGGLTTPAHESDDEESFDGLPPGMSPPVMMSPARPPRSSAELGLLRLGQTPTREASSRITRDLVRDIQSRSGNATGFLHSRAESTFSTMPTPPSLSRYHRHDTTDSIIIDSSLESMMRRVGLNVPSSVATSGMGTASTPGLRLRSQAFLKAAEPPVNPPATPPPPQLHLLDDEPITPVHPDGQMDIDSDSDSMDEMNNTAHPSAAFLMASSGHSRQDSDDSFGSSNHSSDSLNDDDGGMGLAPVNPFPGGIVDDGFDDSYDDDSFNGLDGEVPEETLFGVPPVQRMQAQRRVHSGGHLGDELRMLGEDLLEDTIGIGAQMGRVEDTPTPAAWGSRE
ncbi:hypothetical protein DXG03_009043 [Asterophora parasitica]|uniref:DASH complex subunit ASK1 n=1 Tax=Asterophora parasitica TaxID=117018 RepID=A0A9P7G8J6_9AGAR|nr:hypothetical protein DXG03_009043 [Asterophora parasitica]